MTLRDQIQQDATQALKNRDVRKLDALRFLIAQIKNREIDAKRTLTDEEAIKSLQTEAKQRRESIEAYQKGQRQDLVDKEKFELELIGNYLPKQLTDEEILQIVSQVKVANPGAEFGILMKETMKQIAGRADGGRVAKLVSYPK